MNIAFTCWAAKTNLQKKLLNNPISNASMAKKLLPSYIYRVVKTGADNTVWEAYEHILKYGYEIAGSTMYTCCDLWKVAELMAIKANAQLYKLSKVNCPDY